MTEKRWRRALVTGASSGIGEAFADELAGRSVDLILVGRDSASLEAAAERARSRGVDAVTIRTNLAEDQDVARLLSILQTSEPMVDLLVNNAGIGQFGFFVELPLEGAIETLRVNNEALVRLTHAGAARMVEAGRGTIIQLSSTAAASPGPQQAVYAATKAFVSSFGQALSDELRGTGVTCTTVLPGYTRTRYFSRVGISPEIPAKHWMTATQVARISLDAAGRSQPLVIPGTRNRWKIALATPFPSLAKGRSKRGLDHLRQAIRQLRGRLVR